MADPARRTPRSRRRLRTGHPGRASNISPPVGSRLVRGSVNGTPNGQGICRRRQNGEICIEGFDGTAGTMGPLGHSQSFMSGSSTRSGMVPPAWHLPARRVTGRQVALRRGAGALIVFLPLLWALQRALPQGGDLVNSGGIPLIGDLLGKASSPRVDSEFLQIVLEATATTLAFAALGTAGALVIGLLGGPVLSDVAGRVVLRGAAPAACRTPRDPGRDPLHPRTGLGTAARQCDRVGSVGGSGGDRIALRRPDRAGLRTSSMPCPRER